MSFDVSAGGESLLQCLAQQGQRYRTWRATVLDHTTPDRMVVAYTLGTASDSPSHQTGSSRVVIGKFFADQTGQATFRIMQSIHACLTKTQDRPSVATPMATPPAIGYDSKLRLLWQEKAPGLAYPQAAAKADADSYFIAAGQALAQLHRLEIEHAQPKRMADHIRELIRPHPSQLARAYPSYRRLIDDTLHHLVAVESQWGQSLYPAPLHRDFQLRQLFYAQGQVWVIDWDLFAHGDPAFDVAYFTVYLKTHLAADRSARLIDAFQEGYFALQPDSILERVPVYEAFNYLRRACRRYRLQDDGWQDQMTAMLRELERRLA